MERQKSVVRQKSGKNKTTQTASREKSRGNFQFPGQKRRESTAATRPTTPRRAPPANKPRAKYLGLVINEVSLPRFT